MAEVLYTTTSHMIVDGVARGARSRVCGGTRCARAKPATPDRERDRAPLRGPTRDTETTTNHVLALLRRVSCGVVVSVVSTPLAHVVVALAGRSGRVTRLDPASAGVSVSMSLEAVPCP